MSQVTKRALEASLKHLLLHCSRNRVIQLLICGAVAKPQHYHLGRPIRPQQI